MSEKEVEKKEVKKAVVDSKRSQRASQELVRGYLTAAQPWPVISGREPHGN